MDISYFKEDKKRNKLNIDFEFFSQNIADIKFLKKFMKT